MCEFIAGQVIASFPRDDKLGLGALDVARSQFGYEIVTTLGWRAHEINPKNISGGLPHEYVLIAVPEGTEQAAITNLQALYTEQVLAYGSENVQKERSLRSKRIDPRFLAAPDSVVSAAAPDVDSAASELILLQRSWPLP